MRRESKKGIAQSICEQGADYLVALKGNQRTLNEHVALYFRNAVEKGFSITHFDYQKTADKDHGRIEIR